MWRTRNAQNKETRHTSIPAQDVATDSWGDALILEPVLDDGRREIDDTAPPASPAVGDRYIIGPNATGDWTGGTNKITEWNGTDWSTQQYPFQEIYNLYGTALGVGGDRGVLVYCRKRAQYLQYTKVEQQDLVEPLATEVLLRTSGVAAASNYMTWLPLHEANSLHSAFKNPVDSVDVATGSWGTPYIYQRRIVPAGAPAPYNAHIGHIGIWAPISSAAAGAWVFNKPTEGELVWVTDKNQFYYYNGTTWVPLGNNIALNDLSDVVAPSPSLGDVVYFDGSHWVNQPASTPGAHDLDSHSDVTITAPTDRQVVLYDNGTSEFINDDLNIADLGDVNLTGLANGYTFVWNSGTSKWDVAAGPAAAPHQFLSASHSNTVVTGSQTTGDVAYYNGTNWTNRPNSLANLLTVSITGPTSGQILTYNGSNWVNGSVSGTINLDDLANVNTTGKLNHDIIWWDAGTGKWVYRTLVLGDISNVSTAGAVNGQSLVFNGSTWGPGNPTATVTAEWGYFYSTGGGFLTGGASGVTLNTGFSPNRFIVGSTGKWQITVSTSANAPDVEISTSAGGVTPACTFTNNAIVSLSAGQYFTISAGPNPVGNRYSVSIMKVGN